MNKVKSLIDTLSPHSLQIFYGYLWDWLYARDKTWDIKTSRPEDYIQLSNLRRLREDALKEIMDYTLMIFDQKTFLPSCCSPKLGGIVFGFHRKAKPYLFNTLDRASYPDWIE